MPLLAPMSDSAALPSSSLPPGRARACAPTRTRCSTRSPAGRCCCTCSTGRRARRGQARRGRRQGPRAGRSGARRPRRRRSRVQAEQKGTGHAVQQAADALAGFDGPVLILYGDTPFVEAETLRRMLDRLDGDGRPGRGRARRLARRSGKTMAAIILGEGDRIAKMVEYKDANEDERAVRLCNSRHDGGARRATCSAGSARSATTMPRANIICPTSSMIAAARRPRRGRDRGRAVRDRGRQQPRRARPPRARMAAPPARAGAGRGRDPDRPRKRLVRLRHASSAATCTVEPHVVFGPGVKIADGATIHAFSHIEGAIIGAGCEHRPVRAAPARDASSATGAKVGNFVEVKKATLGEGAKANHLSYIGDADGRRERQHRRRHDHLQLRRLRQVSDGDRRGRLHRLEHRAGRAGDASATARSSARARSSPRMSRPTALRSRAASRRALPAGPRASASAQQAKKDAEVTCAELSGSSGAKRSRSGCSTG